MAKKGEVVKQDITEEIATEQVADPIVVALQKELLEVKKANAYLIKRLDYYEQDGVNKLLFALNRKSNEMAVVLNKTDISTIALDNKDDKTFERLKIIWNDASSISNNIKVLESLSKSGELKKELIEEPIDSEVLEIVNRPIFTPESMADAVGELAGKRY